jgi:hypothetical protein
MLSPPVYTLYTKQNNNNNNNNNLSAVVQGNLSLRKIQRQIGEWKLSSSHSLSSVFDGG